MNPRRAALLAAVSVLLTTLIARLDRDASSFVDLARLENVPAVLVYSTVFFGLLALVTGALLRRPGERRE